jgi:hypothetical protein
MTAPLAAQQVAAWPVSAFSSDERFSWLIHGAPKAGKTSLASTAPKPILALDGEGSWRFVPNKIYWNPMMQPPPVYDGSWQVCVVLAHDWNVVERVLQMLLTQPLPFTSVVIDSITEIQRRLKRRVWSQATGRDPRQQWGVLLDTMSDTIRGYRDLCMIDQVSVRGAIFVAESEPDHDTGFQMPSMQGRIQTHLGYWVDLVGYLYPDTEIVNNVAVPVRRLWIGSGNSRWASGSRFQNILGHQLTCSEVPPGTLGSDVEVWMRYAFDVIKQTNIITTPNGRTTA